MRKIARPTLLVIAGVLIGLYPSIPDEIKSFISYLGTIIGCLFYHIWSFQNSV